MDPAGADSSAAAETAPCAKGEILIVEDAPESLALLSHILMRAGYAVRQAPDGELALWTLNTRLPDLLLLDVRMPGIDGFEVCRRLKADPRLSTVPVIFLSALDSVEDKVKGLALGAVDYIAKPYRSEEVLARVDTHITLSRLRQALDAIREQLDQRVSERTAELEHQKQEMANVLAALDMAGDGIVKIGPDDRISYANHALPATFGLPGMSELAGWRIEDIPTGGRPLIDPADMRALRDTVNRIGHWQGELALWRAGETTARRLLAHVRALPDGGQVAILTDVTNVRRREEEQRRLELELKQARRLEALGQLASGVAHDFNNLLGAILGFAQFIAEDTGDDTPHHRYASRIIKAGQQAKSLIGQIMTFSQRQEEAAEAIDLGTMVDENLSILKAVSAPSTALCVTRPDGPVVIAGQRNQLVQILMNLVVNGSEALQGRPGTVTIELAHIDAAASGIPRPPAAGPADPVSSDPAAAGGPVTWTDAGGWLGAALGTPPAAGPCIRLTVRDDGEGMTAETLARIFTPFFTTKGPVGGSGLGLAVVHRVVTAHRGAITVTTAPGCGSRFDVVFPEPEDGGMSPAESADTTAAVRHKGSILLVDDSTHFGDMLMTALFRLGYEISVCDDPVDAVGYVQEDPGAWDLVITDQAMMNMSGTELVAAVKQIRPGLPCIICTAFPAGITEEAARQAGADGFATKPLDLGKFSVMVKEVLTR
ncbi:DNA-binding response OmpR family regulator/nitrogen-specific signal transduction histidine kinase [Azospirillum fermentarium]|uniref:response regulator n=1 Tax=Azospirillum fermentarium TaxID=1233114 RepID=UPI0022271B99|nr:response regulator [Azospirillum fermentarium]MCW2244431.1 DNA-binding response OmpR family regulator/nitrogen-specific signal transduction histidine kinase [Azospirillum fermentarium]